MVFNSLIKRFRLAERIKKKKSKIQQYLAYKKRILPIRTLPDWKRKYGQGYSSGIWKQNGIFIVISDKIGTKTEIVRGDKEANYICIL
jgi:hypothetical protein